MALFWSAGVWRGNRVITGILKILEKRGNILLTLALFEIWKKYCCSFCFAGWKSITKNLLCISYNSTPSHSLPVFLVSQDFQYKVLLKQLNLNFFLWLPESLSSLMISYICKIHRLNFICCSKMELNRLFQIKLCKCNNLAMKVLYFAFYRRFSGNGGFW